jgi:hypothetical protein
MTFTFWSVVVPFFLCALGNLLAPQPIVLYPRHPVFALGALWGAFGVPAAMLYWTVRLGRHAWGNGSAAHQAPPSIEYSEPDSGRIFGRLS